MVSCLSRLTSPPFSSPNIDHCHWAHRCHQSMEPSSVVRLHKAVWRIGLAPQRWQRHSNSLQVPTLAPWYWPAFFVLGNTSVFEVLRLPSIALGGWPSVVYTSCDTGTMAFVLFLFPATRQSQCASTTSKSGATCSSSSPDRQTFERNRQNNDKRKGRGLASRMRNGKSAFTMCACHPRNRSIRPQAVQLSRE